VESLRDGEGVCDTLQKALRNEPIAMFDPDVCSRRIQTALKALERGDEQFAARL
jgi:uncharacterized protein YlaI